MCPSCGSHHAYMRVSQGPGLSRYVSVPLGLLCLAGMIMGGMGWLAKDPFSLHTATAIIFIEVGVASVLLFGLLLFAEIQARRSRRVDGFCGRCGDRWTEVTNRGGHAT